MGTKPAKVTHRPSWPTKAAKPGPFFETADLIAKGLRSTGGPKLLKWGLPGRGVKIAKVAPTSYAYYVERAPPARGFTPQFRRYGIYTHERAQDRWCAYSNYRTVPTNRCSG